jgi:hypothetical protein
MCAYEEEKKQQHTINSMSASDLPARNGAVHVAVAHQQLGPVLKE